MTKSKQLKTEQTTTAVRACLIINPKSGRGGVDLSDALTVLQAHGWETVVRQKLHDGDATKLAREAVADGYDIVVACGGDGTASEVAGGLVGTNVAMGALPGGTVNVWARELGISDRLRVAATQLATAERRPIDLGYVTINGKHGQHFLMMAGIGADAAIMGRVSRPLKNRLGALAVGVAAIEALPSLVAAPVRVELDGAPWQGRVPQIILGNTRRYGGFAQITPDAYADDGLLDICLMTVAGPVAAARQLGSLFLKQRPNPATAEIYRAATITVHSPLPLPLELDGSDVDQKDIEMTTDGTVYAFTVIPLGLSVLVPRTYDGALFQPTRLSTTFRLAGAAPPAPGAGNGANGLHTRALAPWQARQNGSNAGKTNKKEKGHNGRKGQMCILAVGANKLTAQKLRSGRVVTVLVSPETRIEDGARRALDLGALAEGALVTVQGEKDRASGTITARRIRLASAGEAVQGSGARQQ